MKVLLEIKDAKAAFVMELLSNRLMYRQSRWMVGIFKNLREYTADEDALTSGR